MIITKNCYENYNIDQPYLELENRVYRLIPTPSPRLSCLVVIVSILLFTLSISLTATAQQQTTTKVGIGGAAATTTTTTTTTPSLTPLTPPLTLQEQQQQIRLQNVIASTTLNLQETQKQIGGVVFTPRWSQPIWINANSVAVLVAYCLPGEFADSGQEILGGFGLEILESYGVALPQGGFMAWMAVVGNEDIQNRRLPAALGVMCASDLNKPETRVLSPEKQQEINNINEQFVNIQNTQINDIDNLINVINTVITTTTTTPPATPPPTPPGQNRTGGGAAGTTTLAAAPVQQQDTTPPTIIVPEDIVVQATNEQGAQVFYTVTAQDNVDGTITLEEDGGITRDNVTTYANLGGTSMPGETGGSAAAAQAASGESAAAAAAAGSAAAAQAASGESAAAAAAYGIHSSQPSGSLFPIGQTTVKITAKDSSGNEATQSLTVTVNPPPSGQTPSQDNTETGGSSSGGGAGAPSSLPPSPPEIPLETPSSQAPPVVIEEDPSPLSPSPQEPPAEEGEEGDEEGEGEEEPQLEDGEEGEGEISDD